MKGLDCQSPIDIGDFIINHDHLYIFVL